MYDFILDEMVWSYSRLSQYNNCPHSFFLKYIKNKEGISGCFGQYGSFVHELLEKYSKNELCIFELAPEYIDKFTSKVTAYFPPMKDKLSMASIYFEQGKEYFETFNGFDENYIIKDIEKKYYFKLDKYNFVGIIDLEVENKNGWYEIIDHKTKNKQHTTRLSKKRKEQGFITLVDKRYIPWNLIIQLYLYCIPMKEKYGEYPRYLNFNMCRINDWYKIEFNKKDFYISLKWCLEIINKIYKDDVFYDNISQFYCDFLCDQNINCKFSSKYQNC